MRLLRGGIRPSRPGWLSSYVPNHFPEREQLLKLKRENPNQGFRYNETEKKWVPF